MTSRFLAWAKQNGYLEHYALASSKIAEGWADYLLGELEAELRAEGDKRRIGGLANYHDYAANDIADFRRRIRGGK